MKNKIAAAMSNNQYVHKTFFLIFTTKTDLRIHRGRIILTTEKKYLKYPEYSNYSLFPIFFFLIPLNQLFNINKKTICNFASGIAGSCMTWSHLFCHF